MSAQVLEARPAVGTDTVRRCRLCGGALAHSLVDLGMSPLCESFLAPEQLDAMEPYFPLHALVCGSCFLVQLGEYVSPEHIFREYAYFSSYSTSWVAHAQAYCAMIAQAARARPGQPGGRAGEQRRLSAAAFSAAGRARARHRARRQRGQGRARQGHPDPGRVLRRRARRGAARGGPPRRPDRRQQRARPGARPQRLRRRHGAPARARGRDHARVPAPRAADRREPVRHHLPRALLVLLADRDRAPGRPPRAQADRRRGADHPRRLAARLSGARRRRHGGPRRERGRAARARAPASACATSPPTRRSPRRCAAPSAGCSRS